MVEEFLYNFRNKNTYFPEPLTSLSNHILPELDADLIKVKVGSGKKGGKVMLLDC